MPKKYKRVLVLSDMHSGHHVGLTHPDWQKRKSKYYEYQHKMWNFYQQTIESLKPIDIVVFNGDAIEGKGEKSGGTELLTADRDEQCEIAIDNLSIIKPKEFWFVAGTPYHTGVSEDFEKKIAKHFNSKFKSHLFLKVNDLIFSFKHKIGTSTIPYGRYTPLAKEKMWNLYWEEINGQPKVDVFGRSHVHYFDYCGNDSYLALTTPALQGIGSKFGSRQCSGIVKIGMVSFDIIDRDNWSWNSHIMKYKIDHTGNTVEIGLK